MTLPMTIPDSVFFTVFGVMGVVLMWRIPWREPKSALEAVRRAEQTALVTLPLTLLSLVLVAAMHCGWIVPENQPEPAIPRGAPLRWMK